MRTRSVLGIILVVMQASTVFGEDTTEDAMKTANRLFAEGDFAAARQEYEKSLQSTPDNPEATERLGFICFFKGQYEKAVEYFSRAIELDPSKKTVLLIYTALADYAKGDFSGAVKALEEAGSPRVGVLNPDQLKKLQGEDLYQVQAEIDRAVIPFERSDPLPLVPMRVNSKDILVLIDTGGGQLILDEEFAEENSIGKFSTQQVDRVGGGKTATLSFGKVDSIELHGITVKNVPVWIMPTRRWSRIFDGDLSIDGVLGTEVLMQFLPTIDYPGEELILRTKTPQNRAEIASMEPKSSIPFIIDGIHTMFAQALINEKGPVLMCFDSGLADDHQASMTLSGAALEDLGISEPEMTEDGIGAGEDYRYGYVEIDSVQVGPLRREGGLATYDGVESSLYALSGFKTYGIISHHFLKHYRWTIDFDNRVFLFDD